MIDVDIDPVALAGHPEARALDHHADVARHDLDPVGLALRHDLDQVLHALEHPHRIGAPRTVAEALVAGNAGVARIPGKHGQDRRFAAILVTVPDEPGELGRLLTEIGEEGVNMEDLRLEHSPGAQVGFAEIAVLPEAAHRLAAALEGRGWSLVETKGSDA